MGSWKVWFGLAATAALCGVAGAGFVPVEVPFVVNTETEGIQSSPAAAIDSLGTAIVVWDSDDLGPGESDIAGRLVDGAGAVVGSEFQINASTPDSQLRPAVAALADGGFVVVWESYSFDSGDDALGFRLVDGSGNLVGSEGQLDLTELHLRPDVAELSGGDLLIVWDDGFDVFGRRYSANATPVGDEFQINMQLGSMSAAQIGAAADGDFTVVWQDYRSEIDGDGDTVLMRRFASDGTPLSGDLQVNTTTEGDQYSPSIGMRDDGAFVVVWEAYGQEANGDGAFGQAFDGSGSTVGAEFRVDSGGSAYAGYVDAAATADGFAVVWNEPREEGGDVLNTFLRPFGADGSGGTIVNIDPTEQGDQAGGVVATGEGRLLVAWQGDGLEDQDIFAQSFDLPSDDCAGDCDGDGVVSIAELVRAVNIALGSADVGTCVAADRDDDGMVAINELIRAVNSALQGCVAS